MYVSGTPLDDYISVINKISGVAKGIDFIDEENKDMYDGKEIKVCGIVTKTKILSTKNEELNDIDNFFIRKDSYGSDVIVPCYQRQFVSNLCQICAFSNHGDLIFTYHYFSFPFFFFNGRLVQKKKSI